MNLTTPGRQTQRTWTNHSAAFDQFKTRIQQREARIGIIGLGYVGLPLALLFSEEKFRVTGFDIDPRKIDTLAKAGPTLYRITRMKSSAAQARVFPPPRITPKLAEMDAVIICVPTP